jgi:hypothetical protein
MAVPALSEGLRRGEKLMFIAEEPEPNRLTGIGDVEQLLVSRQLEVLHLAALHPVRSTGDVEPRFSLFADGDAVFVVGAVDADAAEQLRRLLSVGRLDQELVVDLSAAHLMDEQALLVLAQTATGQRPLRVRANAGLKERLAAVCATASSLQIEHASGSEARCACCGDVVGSYEEAVLVLEDAVARTSLVADPDRFAAAVARFHGACYDG